jgi:hypothetical protein
VFFDDPVALPALGLVTVRSYGSSPRLGIARSPRKPPAGVRRALGALLAMGASGCLVFDGLTPKTDGGSDATRSDAPTVMDAPHGGDVIVPDTDSGVVGVACEPGKAACLGGPAASCCAKLTEAAWSYMCCSGLTGYFQYECDDSSDCDAGQICCATAPKTEGVPAYPFSSCRASCPAGGVTLCQPSRAGCGPGNVCSDAATPYQLPPAYLHCKSD